MKRRQRGRYTDGHDLHEREREGRETDRQIDIRERERQDIVAIRLWGAEAVRFCKGTVKTPEFKKKENRNSPNSRISDSLPKRFHLPPSHLTFPRASYGTLQGALPVSAAEGTRISS
jgi:hypothetical protein